MFQSHRSEHMTESKEESRIFREIEKLFQKRTSVTAANIEVSEDKEAMKKMWGEYFKGLTNQKNGGAPV